MIDSNNGESNNNVDFTDTNNGFDNLTEIESKKEEKKRHGNNEDSNNERLK